MEPHRQRARLPERRCQCGEVEREQRILGIALYRVPPMLAAASFSPASRSITSSTIA